MDLNAEPEGSSDTPTSTFIRPIGTKAAKAQAEGKAKAAASGSAPLQATPLPSTQFVASTIKEFGGFREVYEYRFILDAQNNLHQETDPEKRRRTERMIKIMSQKLN